MSQWNKKRLKHTHINNKKNICVAHTIKTPRTAKKKILSFGMKGWKRLKKGNSLKFQNPVIISNTLMLKCIKMHIRKSKRIRGMGFWFEDILTQPFHIFICDTTVSCTAIPSFFFYYLFILFFKKRVCETLDPFIMGKFFGTYVG